MPAPNDVELARIRICETENGTYTNLGYVRSADFQRGSEGSTIQKWMGGRRVRAGDRTIGGRFPIWWTDDDATGQAIAEAAWESGDTVFFQICPKGTTATTKVFQFGGTVDEAPISIDTDGESIEGEFGVTGDISTYEVVTLA